MGCASFTLWSFRSTILNVCEACVVFDCVAPFVCVRCASQMCSWLLSFVGAICFYMYEWLCVMRFVWLLACMRLTYSVLAQTVISLSLVGELVSPQWSAADVSYGCFACRRRTCLFIALAGLRWNWQLD